jgi:hypothetical protein
MSDEEYSVAVSTDNYTIEVDTSSDNLSSSVAIEISDPVSNTVEVNTGLANNVIHAADIIGLTSQINDVLQSEDIGVNTNKGYLNISSDTYLDQESQIIFVDSGSSDVNVYLPTASGIGGYEILVKNIGDNNVIVHGSGSETIDDIAFFSINFKFQSSTFASNNSNWFIV